MTSFRAARLISFLLLLCALGQPISSTTLTLKSSHSHLNLNRILNANLDRSTVRLSFKYKPLNRRFTLISGILHLQSSELAEPLKFVLIVNSDDRLELIVTKPNKPAAENLLSSYFVQEANQTEVFPSDRVDSFRYGPEGSTVDSLISRGSIRLDGKEEQRADKSVDHEKRDNWRLFGVLIDGERLKIAHTAYADCLSNSRKQLNCRQRSLIYRLADDWSADALANPKKEFRSRTEPEPNDEQITRAKENRPTNGRPGGPQSIELNQLLIGKEWSESDSYLIKLADRSTDSPGPADLKQLNETEDQHSKSQIHNNFLQSSTPNFQTSNQEQFSGLIGCLNTIELNGHYLEFSVANRINESHAANEPNRTDSVERADQRVQIDKKIKMETELVRPVADAASRAVKAVEKDRRTTAALRNIVEDVRIVKNVNTSGDQIDQIESEEADSDWWQAYRWHDVLVGRIELNVCNQSDPCANYCLHNAACMLNEGDGQPICHCDLVGYTGERCFFPLYKRNCKELELLGFRSNGQYIVDSDGVGPHPPSHIYCKFRTKEHNETKTLIYHNLKEETVIRGASYAKPFFFKLKYRDFSQEMLVNYMNQFRTCKQEIRFDCHQARFGFLYWCGTRFFLPRKLHGA